MRTRGEKDQKEVKGHHTVKSQQQDDVEPSQADDSQIHDEVEMMLSKKLSGFRETRNKKKRRLKIWRTILKKLPK